MKGCIFCEIVAGKAPAAIVHEDEHLLAFEDIRPQAPVHILIIPKEHFSSLNDVPEEKMDILGKILLTARKIAREKGLQDKGYRIVLNTNRDSGQAVFHIHFHLLGARRMSWPPG